MKQKRNKNETKMVIDPRLAQSEVRLSSDMKRKQGYKKLV
jgi:uncharacterized protein YbaA (DUF1428 family)